MKILTFLPVVFVLLTLFLTCVELHSLRIGPKGKKCIDNCQCPNGTACLPESNGVGSGKRRKICLPCSCREMSQCRKPSNEVICDCSNSGYTGSNCETEIGTPCGSHEACNEGDTCPDGWIKFQCSCYMYVSTEVDWQTAKSDCQSKGAYLVEITTKAESDFIYSFVEVDDYTWTGLTDIGAEGTFVWECSGESPDYIVNDAIDFNTELNDCVKSGFYWEAVTCSTNQAYICEKAL
ncbi:perlucin-like protein [Ruditapes philippinarum]|uniref:perlucin-like protein n=1 Tax=Ruditapes philippinarum TaxID=129788 RepID=UPI00295ADFC9|nr:perlucin-like protein [Ruditapes philippinarum]